MTAELSKICA